MKNRVKENLFCDIIFKTFIIIKENLFCDIILWHNKKLLRSCYFLNWLNIWSIFNVLQISVILKKRLWTDSAFDFVS